MQNRSAQLLTIDGLKLSRDRLRIMAMGRDTPRDRTPGERLRPRRQRAGTLHERRGILCRELGELPLWLATRRLSHFRTGICHAAGRMDATDRTARPEVN